MGDENRTWRGGLNGWPAEAQADERAVAGH